MTKIVHISDWHGRWYTLPEADLYIITGDMLPNFDHLTRNKVIKPATEVMRQTKYLDNLTEVGSLRRFLNSPGAPVVIVRGNHDFVDYGSYFGGEVFEVNLDSTRYVKYCGLKIGGFRGIPPVGGCWADELPQEVRLARINQLPHDLDIVVSHAPPRGILSYAWGCGELRWRVDNWLGQDGVKPKLFCFGHVHEDGGKVIEYEGALFSNASLNINKIEI